MTTPIKTAELMDLSINGRGGKISFSFTMVERAKYEDGREYVSESKIISKDLTDIAAMEVTVGEETVTPSSMLKGLRALGKELLNEQMAVELQLAEEAVARAQESQALVEGIDPALGGELG